MTELQLKIQQRADKELSFGSLLMLDEKGYKTLTRYVRDEREGGERFIITEEGKEIRLNSPKGHHCTHETIGHPMNRGRLCYIVRVCHEKKVDHTMFDLVSEYHMKYDSEVLQGDILTRPEDFQKRVLAFLESLPSDLLSKV